MPDDIPSRVAILEEIARTTRDTLDRLDRRLDRMEARMDGMEPRWDRRFETLENGLRKDMAELRADIREMHREYRWMMGIMLGGFASLLAVMAHGFHWL